MKIVEKVNTKGKSFSLGHYFQFQQKMLRRNIFLLFSITQIAPNRVQCNGKASHSFGERSRDPRT